MGSQLPEIGAYDLTPVFKILDQLPLPCGCLVMARRCGGDTGVPDGPEVRTPRPGRPERARRRRQGGEVV